MPSVRGLNWSRVSRLYTDGSTTQGFRSASSLLYVDQTALTVEVWCYWTGTPGGTRRMVESGENATSRGWSLRSQSNGKMSMNMPFSTSNKTYSATNNIGLNRWTHAIFRDAAVKTPGASIDAFIDGVLDNTGTTTNGAGAQNTGTAFPLSIGTGSVAGTTSPGMALARVAVWNRKLADVECRSLYIGAVPADFDAGLIGYWDLNAEQGAGLEPDLSGFGLHMFQASTGNPTYFTPAPRVRPLHKRSIRYVPGGAASTLSVDDASIALGIDNVNVQGPTTGISNGPSSVQSGVAISPAIVVTVQVNGVTDTAYNGNVTASLATGIGTLNNATVAAVNGVATFSTLAVNGDGGGYSLTFTPSGGVYPAATTGTFYTLGTAMNAAIALITALGGNANVKGFYDRRLSLGIAAGKVATWDDAVGAYGGRTPGPQFAQATAGSRPALSGVQGSGSETVTLASANTQHLATPASFPAFSSTTPLFAVVIGALTADGYLAGLAADPTSAATYPYAVVEGAGGNWKGDVARTGSGNRSQSDTGVAYAGGATRVSIIGKGSQFAAGHGNFAEEYFHFFGARQPQYFATMSAATAGSMKGTIGRLGATYCDGSIAAVIMLAVDPTQAVIKAIYAYAAAQHGATIEASKRNTLIVAGSSLVYGSQSTDPVTFAAGTGTTAFPYVGSRRNTGTRGTWVAQGLDVGDSHSFNYGVSGADYVALNSRFDTLIAPAVDNYRTGPFVLVCMEIGNTIETNTFSAAQVLAEMAALATKVHALGGKLYHFTCGDRGGGGLTNFGWYDSIGGALSTQGQVALDVNAALRASPGTYGDGYIEHELSAGNHFVINRAVSHASDDVTYFQTARVHYTDTGYALAGQQLKDFFDADDTILWPAVNDETIGLAIDSPALTQANVLVVGDLALALGIDPVALTQANVVAVADSALALAIDAIALTQANVLAVADEAFALAIDAPALTQANVLGVVDAAFALGIDSPVLSVGTTLTVADALLALAADNVVLVQANTLAVADALFALALEAPTLGIPGVLVVADALTALAIDSPTLSVAFVLSVDDGVVGMAIDAVTVSQANLLAVADVLIALLLGTPALTSGNAGSINGGKTRLVVLDYSTLLRLLED